MSGDLKAMLAGKLTPAEIEQVTRSYDIVGSIAIIEVPAALLRHQVDIANAVMTVHKQVKTVLKKQEKTSGEFRTRPLVYIAGEDTRETLVVESGCKLLIDVEHVYYSVRSSSERLRIAQQVTPQEDVLVLFSGAGPFVVVLAKHSLASRIAGVEKNPVGHKYAEENLRLNKVTNAELYNADAADLSFLKGVQFDRVIMPLPESSLEFLPQALSACKAEAVLHVYVFAKADELEFSRERIVAACRDAGFHAKVQDAVKAGHRSPFVYRWCFDVHVARL